MTAEPLRGDELYRFLVDTYYDAPSRSRRMGYWVMSRPQLDECEKLMVPPVPLDYIATLFGLFGLSAVVRPGAGIPHLVAE